MKSICFLFLAGLFLALTSRVCARPPSALVQLRYKFTPGQTLRYLIQRDPYFADPAEAIVTLDPNAPYQPPLVERLTENVLTVGRDGTATLKITVGPEPGFEEGAAPSTVQTLTVTPLGQILSSSTLSPIPQLLLAFFRLPAALVKPEGGKTARLLQTRPVTVTEDRSRGHDGLLLQTTRRRQRDSVVFDLEAGNLRQQRSEITATLSLVMLERGARGVADFGHVIPSVQVVQTMTIERRDDLPYAPLNGG